MDTQSKPISVVDLLISVHEAGHAVAAMEHGCRVAEMVLLQGSPDQPGGFTQLESYVTDRRLEAVRHLAGPIAEVTAAGVTGVLKTSALAALVSASARQAWAEMMGNAWRSANSTEPRSNMRRQRPSSSCS